MSGYFSACRLLYDANFSKKAIQMCIQLDLWARTKGTLVSFCNTTRPRSAYCTVRALLLKIACSTLRWCSWRCSLRCASEGTAKQSTRFCLTLCRQTDGIYECVITAASACVANHTAPSTAAILYIDMYYFHTNIQM
jgi:hypothetical protein